VIFNAPVPVPDPALSAVKMALEMRAALAAHVPATPASPALVSVSAMVKGGSFSFPPAQGHPVAELWERTFP